MPKLRIYIIRYVTREKTFSIDKAKNILGYKPEDDMDQSISEGVAWHLMKKSELDKKKLM